QCCFFFFQAEDGIRDFHVTGVQTCALPISLAVIARPVAETTLTGPCACADDDGEIDGATRTAGDEMANRPPNILICSCEDTMPRSEERRVGKEGRSAWWRQQ